jgi:[protein-PII] uridylyltransferase
MRSSDAIADPIKILRAEQERLREEHSRGLSGRRLVHDLTAAMDAAVRSIWRAAPSRERGVALVALGGYGRRELSPHSDVDLMVLREPRAAPAEAGSKLFYELWDAGFTVGHATRTVKESVRIAGANLEAETSFLNARLLDGDGGLFERFRAQTLARTRRGRRRFLEAIRASIETRYAADGYATYWLEPNVRDGAGGLRDHAVLGWLEQAFGDVLTGAGPGDTAAETEVLLRVRNELHYLTGRRTDVLAVANQSAVAAGLGHAGPDAVDELLRELYASASRIAFAVSIALSELRAATSRRRAVRQLAPGVVLDGGRVTSVELAGDVASAMRVFASAAREGAAVGAATMEEIRGALGTRSDPLPWTPEIRRSFFEILAQGERGADALEMLERSGLLARLIPEWSSVRHRPQHNVYHRFTVDVHLRSTVAAACALGGAADEPLARDVWRDVADRERLLLACLLHDIGKGSDGDHSIAGEAVARRICGRMGIGDVAASEVAWLVRHHLLLPDTATRRDTGDENLVVDLAASVGTPERLKMLYLLSVADARATGPAAWTPWKGALVGELFTKVLRVLEGSDVAGREASDLFRFRARELAAALDRYPAEAVSRHLAAMPRSYFLAFPTVTLARHFALMSRQPGPGEVVTHVARLEATDAYAFTVVAGDRPGLFSDVAGALALNGLNVLAAQIFTRADGLALELFDVEGAFEKDVDPARWERVAADVRAILTGNVNIDERLAEKRVAYRRPSKGKREAPRVVVDDKASDFFTVIEVSATDRVGLLHSITRGLADAGLDIHSAKVATYAEDVVDVFYVRDAGGQKVGDSESVEKIERAVLSRIGD